jgi:hypothetical protein
MLCSIVKLLISARFIWLHTRVVDFFFIVQYTSYHIRYKEIKQSELEDMTVGKVGAVKRRVSLLLYLHLGFSS